MMLRKILALLVLILFVGSVEAQQIGKQKKELFDIGGGNYKIKGWHIGPGITYMLPMLNERSEFQIDPEGAQDTIYSGDFNADGRLGLYLEFGRHRFFQKKLLTYMDYGLAYKSFKGREEFVGVLGEGATRQDYTYSETFSNSFASAFVNFNHIGQIGDYSFIQNSLGLNFDYRIINNQNEVGIQTQAFQPSDMLFQMHYKIGFGFKVNKNLYVVPAIETPILNIVEWEDGQSTLGYFNTRYRPVILSVRFMWFDIQKQADCTGAPEPSSPQLWSKDMRKGMKKKSKRKKKKKKR